MKQKRDTIDEKIHDALNALTRTTLPDHADLRIRGTLARYVHGREETPVSEVLTLEETARYLKLTIGELIPLLDELPSFELAGRLRVRRAALDQWIETREKTLKWQKQRSELKRDDPLIHYAGG